MDEEISGKLDDWLALRANPQLQTLFSILKAQQASCCASILEGQESIRDEDKLRGQWLGLGAAEATLGALIEEFRTAVSVDNKPEE